MILRFLGNDTKYDETLTKNFIDRLRDFLRYFLLLISRSFWVFAFFIRLCSRKKERELYRLWGFISICITTSILCVVNRLIFAIWSRFECESLDVVDQNSAICLTVRVKIKVPAETTYCKLDVFLFFLHHADPIQPSSCFVSSEKCEICQWRTSKLSHFSRPKYEKYLRNFQCPGRLK